MSNLDDTHPTHCPASCYIPMLIPLILSSFIITKRPTVSLSTNLAQRQKYMALPTRHPPFSNDRPTYYFVRSFAYALDQFA